MKKLRCNFNTETLMREILCTVISVCMLFIICSCDKQNDLDTCSSTYNQNVLQNSQEQLLDFSENNYLSITKSNIFAQDQNIYYLKEKVSSQNCKIEFDTFKIDACDSCGNRISYFTYMDDKYGYYCRSDEEANTTGEIGRVDIENNTYEKLIEIPVGNQSGPIVASKDYLVWKESLNKSNWGITRLNIYNIKKKTNETFYNHTIDVNTGRCYAWNWSECVIDGDLIYFDDIVGIKDEIYQVNLYSYNAKTGKINLVKEMAKRPMKIGDGIIWQELNKDKVNTDICLYKNKKVSNVLSFINNSCRAISVGQNGSIVIINGLSSYGGDGINCTGVQIHNNKTSQLLVTKDCVYVETAITDGNIILFTLNTVYKHKPLMFDIKGNKFIELECEKSMYYSLISNSYVYFLSNSQDEMKIIRIELSHNN